MRRALKVTLIVFGAVLILEGLIDIIIPDQRARLMGLGEIAGYVKLLMAILGATWVAVGVWLIVAGREPLLHINWVKFAITKCILVVVVSLSSIILGYVNFSQGGPLVILDAVFAVAFLAFYPWRAVHGTQQAPANKP